MRNIETIKKSINKLPVKDRLDLIKFIKNSYSIFDEYSSVDKCSFCFSERIVKNGSRAGVQKYVCKDCGKNFTFKTNKIISGVHHLDKWNLFVEDFMSLNITPLRELKTRLGVSEQTIFNWRHKLLSSLNSFDTKFTNETIEFDETFFLISRKGRQNLGLTGNRGAYRHWRKSQVGESDYNVKVFFTCGRGSKKIELQKSHMGRTSAEDVGRYFLPSKFDNVTVYTDAHRSYGRFFRNSPYHHETFIGRNHVNLNNPDIHNQTVNAYTGNFKKFVNNTLKGVSTKYLNNYCQWFQFIVNVKNQVQKNITDDKKIQYNVADKICERVVTDNIGLELYRQTEYSFKKFLQQNYRTNYGECKNHYYRAG